ncbi:MAG: ADP-ribosylglycohydrolase family protein [Oscillospiraceae bacterium]|nr:ADP-ribosylglycohydrolase family protein [Oscillospiraceae bacterium]
MTNETLSFVRSVEGAVLGFAVADALGVPVEFTTREERRQDPVCDMRGGGTHKQPAGTWSDDTSMTLCMINSLIEKGIDYEDQMARFADWMINGNYTATGTVFDIGTATQRAISNHLLGRPALKCGDRSEDVCGNGSLMRIMPIAFYLKAMVPNSRGRMLTDRSSGIIHKASDCTHASRSCEIACGIYCNVIFRLCRSDSLADAVSAGLIEALIYYRDHPDYTDLYDRIAPLKDIAAKPEDEIKSGGYVFDTLQAAIWCLLHSGSYADCVLKAVNLGWDTDTTAAVAGALAGTWYGAHRIPEKWIQTLAKHDEIKDLSKRFAYACIDAANRS